MRKSFYEYRISLEHYETRDIPEVLDYKYKYRKTFYNLLQKCNNKVLIQKVKSKVKNGFKILLFAPNYNLRVQARGWALMSPRGIVLDFHIHETLPKLKIPGYYTKLIYACMNKAVEMGLDELCLRIPVNDFKLNKIFEKEWSKMGCDIKARGVFF